MVFGQMVMTNKGFPTLVTLIAFVIVMDTEMKPVKIKRIMFCTFRKK